MSDYDHAFIERDKRLRRYLLEAIERARISPMHGGSGRFIVNRLRDLYLAPDQGLEGDEHAMRLLRDLVDKQLVTETDLRRVRKRPYVLDDLFYQVTDKGSSLLRRSVPADPDIDDERNLEEQ